MGFFHQLVVLLWKNWTIKKRHLWVTVFELATPLVLFCILVGLRTKEPIKKLAGTNFSPKPLPSSGMVAVLQEFCPSIDGTDVYGYPIHKHSMIGPFLDHLHHAWTNSSMVNSSLNVSDILNNFNQSWTNMTEASDHLDPFVNNHSKNSIRLYEILKNKQQFEDYLISNLSMSPREASSVLNSTVNLENVLKLVRSTPNLNDQKNRVRRSNPILQNIKDTDTSFNPYDEPFSQSLKPLLNVALYGFPGLLASNLTNMQKKSQEAKLAAIETMVLSPAGLRYLLCNSHSDALNVETADNSSNLNALNANMCRRHDNEQFKSLSKELLSQLNNTAILNAFAMATVGRNQPMSEQYQNNLKFVIKDLEEMQKLSKYIESLVQISQIIPANSCASFEPHAKDLTSWNDTQHVLPVVTLLNATAAPQAAPPIKKGTTEKPKNQTKPDYIALWASIQPLLCGPDKKRKPTHNASDFHLTWDQKRHLGMLLHVLTSNPKILYAPNNTQADNVIQNANTSFAIIDNITKAGDIWRNISKQIRTSLADPKVDATLDWLAKMKVTYHENPDLMNNLTSGQPSLQRFLSSNDSIPKKQTFISQLDQIDNAACGWKKFVSGISINWFKGFATEDDAVIYATSRAYQDNVSVFATLIFEVDEKGRLPRHVTYKIRQNASFTQDTTRIRLSYWRPDPKAWDYRYYEFGFVWLQDVIERSIMWEFIGHDVVSPGAYVHEIPFPCFRFDIFALNLDNIMPLAMIISWVYTVAMFVQHIVYEKERRLKEVMKIMGLSNGVHWLAWFLSMFLQLEIIVTIIAILLKYGRVLGTSNFFIIWLFFSVYAAATIMFCFLLSVLFSKAKVASACSGIVYFMTYLPFAYMSIQDYILHESVPAAAKMAGSLLSTTAFGIGAKYFALYELSGYGVQWDNIAQTPVEGDTFSLLQSLYMLIADTFIYALLTWYIEAVFPGQYGLPRPWYFPFTLSYWMGHGGTESEGCSPRRLWSSIARHGYHSITEEDQAVAMEMNDDARIEPEPSHLNLGVKIEKLTKIYKRGGKKAVNKLSLNFYEDQITSFLGHNGAGKTTTMSILTGLFPPTSGTAYVYGCDIRNDMLNIRKSLGMCPQHNALFDVLTVEEHLWFYARLKGVASKSIIQQMDQFLEDVGLVNKRYCKVDTLSGGMKRKLSVAIAFVGGSKTVILDEPTAGVDPYARRAIWDLIIKYKEGRTILLSTHHMDEADLLGDRIAIISNGKLQCCGSSLFLKSTYGDGYNLTLLKKMSDRDATDTTEASNTIGSGEEKLTKFVHRHVPSANLTQNSLNQVSFNLPFEAAKKGCFHRLFEDLPDNMEDLGVTGYGLSDTTLEEVFLKVDEQTRWESEESSLPEKPTNSHVSNTKLARSKIINDLPLTDDFFNSEPDRPGCSYNHSNYSNNRNVELMPSGGSSECTTEMTQSVKESNPTAEIALEWLNSAPSVDELPKTPSTERLDIEGRENESLLLDYAFGDSTFSVDSNVTQEQTTATHDAIHEPNCDDDDVELLDLEDNNEGRGSYKLSPLMHNLRIIQGLLLKRLHYARRSRKAVFYQIMLPALFVCIAMTVAMTLPSARDPPPLVLSPSNYHNVTQPRGNFIPYSDQSVMYPVKRNFDSQLRDIDAGPQQLIDTFELPSGIGATCILKSHSAFNIDLNKTINSAASGNMKLVLEYFNPECQSSFTRGIPLSQFVPPVDTKPDPVANMTFDKGVPCQCAADRNTYVCLPGYGEYPVTREVVTGDRLIDVTRKEPILPYLRYTTNEYRLHRYGAFSFGEVRETINQSFPGWPSPLRKVAVRDAAQVLYNHKGYHSMPIYLNTFNNALMRANLPKSKGNPAAYGITVINHPMNKTAGALSLDFLLSGTDVVIAIFIIVAMSFVPASFLVFLVAEKQSRAKHLQFISGTGPVTYWLSNYVWDMLNYLFPAALCIMILQIFDLPAYTRGQNAYAVVALFLLYGWSMTPMMYPASFYFNVPSTAYVCLIVLNLFVGITTVVTTFMVSLFRDNKRLTALNDQLETIFLVFPNYNLGKGLMDLTYYEFMNDFYTKMGETDKIRSPFEWDLITRQLVAMAIEGVAGFLVTLLFEVRFFIPGKCKDPPGDSWSANPEDVDVANERHRVEQMRRISADDELIIVDNISKVYKKKQGKTLAVDGLSFGVGRGECFGLLGVNGAGKTTTFRTITGATEVTNGNIRISGHNMTGGGARERLQAQQSTGYCPQFDALFNELTPIEHLLLYSRLRGIPSKDEMRVTNWAIDKLDLTSHKNKPVQDLSGGTRRKLSVAIALVGYPSVVLLDEPTSGMDPGARRFLWDLILDVTKSGRAVLLTSHSMEECEILCGRIAIMVNGKFECVGPTQHLKNRFGDGYMVSIRSLQPSLFVSVFEQVFPNAVLKEQHYHKAAFQVSFSQNDKSVSLSQVFKLLEDRREELKIEDYSVSQTTLDDVFINFAKKQRTVTVANNNFVAKLKQRCVSMQHSLFKPTQRPSPLLDRGYQGSNVFPQSNLNMRGSPNDSSENSQLLGDDDDLDNDDQPLYNFNQAMSLSFLDSTC